MNCFVPLWQGTGSEGASASTAHACWYRAGLVASVVGLTGNIDVIICTFLFTRFGNIVDYSILLASRVDESAHGVAYSLKLNDH
jgi:predicted GNAT superfamily acetyltransferase